MKLRVPRQTQVKCRCIVTINSLRLLQLGWNVIEAVPIQFDMTCHSVCSRREILNVSVARKQYIAFRLGRICHVRLECASTLTKSAWICWPSHGGVFLISRRIAYRVRRSWRHRWRVTYHHRHNITLSRLTYSKHWPPCPESRAEAVVHSKLADRPRMDCIRGRSTIRNNRSSFMRDVTPSLTYWPT